MENILLVEDSRAFSAVLAKAIQNQWNVNVMHAFSLKETEQALSENEFALSIIDLNLPDAPSGEAVDIVLEHKITSIVFTSQISDQLRQIILDKGVADYVLKQGVYNVEYVASIVGRLLKNRSIGTLVVSSNKEKRGQINRWLKVQNLKVASATERDEALQLLERNPEIKVVLVDSDVSGCSGYSLISQIREKYNAEELIVIGLSDVGERNASIHFIKSGANDVMIYPFLPEELHCRINRSLDLVEHFYRLKDLNEQKSKLMGMAAHDIRGPVGNISAACKMLTSKKLTTDRKSELFDIINHASDELLDLLNELLDVSTIESGILRLNLDAVDLKPLIEKRIKFYSTAAEQKEIVIHANLNDGVQVMADSGRMAQVVDNLLSNAIKYSMPGNDVQVLLSIENERARFDVIDNGVGIQTHEANKLFKPFSHINSMPTAGESTTGLGLAISKSIIQQHGGEIGLSPSSEKGCGFFFLLPLLNE